MKLLRWTAFLSWAATIAAQSNNQVCPPDGAGVCYRVGVPATANSANGDVYFQISGPSSLRWIALGQGSQMAGANIFVVYASADGNNVTLSPRSARGYVQPEFNEQAQVSLLEGSGIVNGFMTANVRCSNCRTLGDDTYDVSSSSSSWIWAVRSGSSLRSDSQSADIDRHSTRGILTIDLSRAAVSDGSTNPFIEDNTNNSGDKDDNQGNKDGTSPTQGTPFAISESYDVDKRNRIIKAHGIVMGLAFVIFFPLGAVLIRLLRFKGHVWVHAGVQIFSYVVAIAGLALGGWYASETEEFNQTHPILGLVIMAALLLQPVLGLIHHFRFVKVRRPTGWGRLHTWYGRILIAIGIINGGLGLQLADNSSGGEIAYAVVAGVVFVLYIAIVGTILFRRRRQGQSGGGGSSSRRGPDETKMVNFGGGSGAGGAVAAE